MTRSTAEPELVAEVARIKRAAVEYDTRSNRWLAAMLIAGVVVGVGVWFIPRPIDRDELHFSLAAGLGLTTYFVGGLVFRMIVHRPRAECPACGGDWNSESGNDLQMWLAWHCCPGCGLNMSGDKASQEKLQ